MNNVNENVVDRFLSVLTDLDLPLFGWTATKTRISSEKRDVRVALTGGFAKVAFSVFHKEFPIVLVVSDDVRDIMTQKTEEKFLARAQYHRVNADKKHATTTIVIPAGLPASMPFDILPEMPANAIPAVQLQLNLNPPNLINDENDGGGDKVSERLIAQLEFTAEEEKRLEDLRRTKSKLKDKFDSFDWTTVGFGEAQEGTIGNYTFYFGPAKSLEGKFFYKINGDKENRNTLQDAKDAAFESFWLVLQAKESLKKKQQQMTAGD
jgi:hypothetical protein